MRIALLLCIGAAVVSAVADELDREIAQVKKEIERVNAQRRDENTLAKKEQAEFTAYTKRTADKRAALVHQTDSVKTETVRLAAVNDSLGAALHAVEQQIREQDLQQEYVRKAIVSAVQAVASEVNGLPPLIAGQYRPPLEYLISELQSKSVENTEALFRLMRIVADVRTLSQDIQVVEGSSPVPDLRGSVYRLRIGAFFEAVVDQAGTSAFLWCRDTAQADAGQYRAVDDPAAATAILKAVLIREGKSIPELVNLPLAPCGKEASR